jgi:hypothetical protein
VNALRAAESTAERNSLFVWPSNWFRSEELRQNYQYRHYYYYYYYYSDAILQSSQTQDVIYDMIYSFTVIGLTPGGSSTVHIYTQTVQRTTQ